MEGETYVGKELILRTRVVVSHETGKNWYTDPHSGEGGPRGPVLRR